MLITIIYMLLIWHTVFLVYEEDDLESESRRSSCGIWFYYYALMLNANIIPLILINTKSIVVLYK